MHGLRELHANGMLSDADINLKWGSQPHQAFADLHQYLTYNYHPATGATDLRKFGQAVDLRALSWYINRPIMVIDITNEDDHIFRVFHPDLRVENVNFCEVLLFYTCFVSFVETFMKSSSITTNGIIR